MDHTRIRALANLLDALHREQLREGRAVFTILAEDRISHRDAEVIIAGLMALAGDEGTKADRKLIVTP